MPDVKPTKESPRKRKPRTSTKNRVVSANEPPTTEVAFKSLDRALQRIQDRVRRLLDQQEFIRALDAKILEAPFDYDQVLQHVVHQSLAALPANHVHIALRDPSGFLIHASSDADVAGRKIEASNSLAGRAWRRGASQNISDTRKLSDQEYTRFNKDTVGEYIALLRARRGPLGVLIFERPEQGKFNPESATFAETIAGQVAFAVEQGMIGRGIVGIYASSLDLLVGNRDRATAYKELLGYVLSAVGADFGSILVLQGQQLHTIASLPESGVDAPLSATSSLTGWHLIDQARTDTLRIPDLSATPYCDLYVPLTSDAAMPRMQSEMIIPLVEGGELIGAINVESPQLNAFNDFDQIIGELVASAVTATLGRVTKFDKAEASQIAMAHLGSVTHSFLHRFGHDLERVRTSTALLKKNQKLLEVPSIMQGGMVMDDVLRMDELLKDAGATIEYLVNSYNPERQFYQPSPRDIFEVATRAFDSFRNSKEVVNSNIGIAFSLENDLPNPLGADGERTQVPWYCVLSEQFEEVLRNLLNNAFEALVEGGTLGNPAVHPYIKMRLDVLESHKVRIQVIDNGVGVKPANLKRLFEFGWTTKSAENHRFGGLGLWFCKLYVESRHGQLEILQGHNSETIAQVTLPRYLGAVNNTNRTE